MIKSMSPSLKKKLLNFHRSCRRSSFTATRGYYFLAESNNILLYYISIDRNVQPKILFIYYRFMFESTSMVSIVE